MTTILTKKKDTTGAPAPGDLTNAAGGAELAVNTYDKRLYTKDSGGNVVEVGTNPTILNIDNIQIDGNTISSTNSNGNINLTPNGTGSVVVSKLQVTGTFQLDGNVTVGDSSADTLTINSTITSNLIFTDNTYDIGASGATRPRNLYLAGSATVAGDSSISGQLGIGSVSSSAASVYVASTNLTSAYQVGVNSALIGNSSATSGIFSFYGYPRTAASAFTSTSVVGFYAEDASKGAGSTITNQYGVFVNDQTKGTNNYGVASAVSSGSNKWNIYASGTANNYFAGSVGIGITTPTQQLDVYTGGIRAGNVYLYGDDSDVSWGSSGSRPLIRGNITNNTLQFYTSAGERMRIDSSGKLILGATSADGLFSMGSTSYGTSSIYQSIKNNGNVIIFGVESSAGGSLAGGTSAYSAVLNSQNAYPLAFGTNNTERMRIDSSGNVGVGNTIQSNVNYQFGTGLADSLGTIPNCTIGKRLGVSSATNSPVLSIAYYSSAYGMDLWAGTTDLSPGYIDIRNNDALIFRKNTYGGSATETMRIGSNGYVGIGTSSPTSPIHVVAASSGVVAQFLGPNSYGAESGISLSQGRAKISGFLNTGGGTPGATLRFYTMPDGGSLTEVGQFTLDGSFIVGDAVSRSGYTYKLAGFRAGAASGTAANVGSVTRGGAYCAAYVSASDPGFDWQFGKGAQTGTSTDFEWGTNGGGGTVLMKLSSGGNLTVNGSLSKGSGSFVIDHPLPAMEETHHLVHSFIEGPQADLIYRGRVNLVNGRAEVNIDTASGMTDGTFVLLCRDVQCYTSNESDWIHVRGFVTGNILTIEAQDQTATSSISWMVIGERQDKHMLKTEWTDETGKIIVEPTKASRLYDPTKDPMNPECPDYDSTLKPTI